jgi:tRNA(fMet)-specific endonuclease VapC
MIAFDTDVFTEVLRNNSAFVARASAIPRDQHWIPIVVAEEILRGRLHAVRHAEAGRGAITIDRAYSLLRETIHDFRLIQILPYTLAAETQFQSWRSQRIRIGSRDLRIAAICVVHGAKLVSRNRRDFDHVPGLIVEYW